MRLRRTERLAFIRWLLSELLGLVPTHEQGYGRFLERLVLKHTGADAAQDISPERPAHLPGLLEPTFSSLLSLQPAAEFKWVPQSPPKPKRPQKRSARRLCEGLAE